MSTGQETSGGFPSWPLRREEGNILLLSLLLATMVTALVTAQFFALQKNVRSSNFMNDHGRLHGFAESGIYQAIHELGFKVGLGDGRIGTAAWVTANDLGRDGKASTGDEGEKDGRPTPGEPNVSPVSVGKAADKIGLLTYATDTQWSGVKRVICTAYNTNALATVEVYVKISTVNLNGAGAVYVLPGTALDLNGNSFTINGKDINPDGTVGTSPAVYGIATLAGTPSGANMNAIKDQLTSKTYGQITGVGASPSLGETTGVDFNAIYNGFKSSPKTTVAPATYTSPSWGNYQTNDYRVTYCPGDLHLSGTGKGAGALVVDGTLTMSGSFTFVGIVIVRGDVKAVGGGAGIHVYGTTLVGQTLSAVDPNSDLKLSGTADLLYSSVAIAKAAALLGNNTAILYWNDLK